MAVRIVAKLVVELSTSYNQSAQNNRVHSQRPIHKRAAVRNHFVSSVITMSEFCLYILSNIFDALRCEDEELRHEDEELRHEDEELRHGENEDDEPEVLPIGDIAANSTSSD